VSRIRGEGALRASRRSAWTHQPNLLTHREEDLVRGTAVRAFSNSVAWTIALRQPCRRSRGCANLLRNTPSSPSRIDAVTRRQCPGGRPKRYVGSPSLCTTHHRLLCRRRHARPSVSFAAEPRASVPMTASAMALVLNGSGSSCIAGRARSAFARRLRGLDHFCAQR